MKKVSILLVFALVCSLLFIFVGCTDKNSDEPEVIVQPYDNPLDLSTKEVGYEVPVHPGSEFTYSIGDIIICKVSNFKAVLTEKKNITPDTIIDSYAIGIDFLYYTYEITITADIEVIEWPEDNREQFETLYFSVVVNTHHKYSIPFKYSTDKIPISYIFTTNYLFTPVTFN